MSLAAGDSPTRRWARRSTSTANPEAPKNNLLFIAAQLHLLAVKRRASSEFLRLNSNPFFLLSNNNNNSKSLNQSCSSGSLHLFTRRRSALITRRSSMQSERRIKISLLRLRTIRLPIHHSSSTSFLFFSSQRQFCLAP